MFNDKIVSCGIFFVLFHQSDARSGSQGGCHGGQYGNDEVNDFLPNFFLVHDHRFCFVKN